MFHRNTVCRLTFGCVVYFILNAACFAQTTAIPTQLPAETAPPQPPQIETIDAHDEYVYTIVFSADGKTMVTAAGDNQALLWSWQNRKVIHRLPHDAAVYAAQIRPDGKQIASSSGDGRVTIWDTGDGSKIKEVSDHQNAVHCLAYSADGKYLASIGGEGRKGDTDCRIWSSQDLTLIQKLPGHQRPAYWVGFSPTGKSLVTSGGDQRIHVWKMPNLETDQELFLRDQQIIVAHDSDVYRCDISNDGRWLASAGQDKLVKIWDLNSITWTESAAPPTQDQTESGANNQGSPHAIEMKPTHTLGETKDPYYATKFSRDGKYLATVGDDGSLRIWDTKNFDLLGTIKLAPAALYAVAITPDNQFVVAGGADGTLFVVQIAELIN